MSDSTTPFKARTLIDGQWLDGSGEELVRSAPYGGAPVSVVNAVSLDEADRAVAAARSARKLWATTPALARAAALHRAGDLVAARKEEAARLISKEMGKTYAESLEDVDYAGTAVQLTRAQILQQAAAAMLTQANGEPRAVLALLR